MFPPAVSGPPLTDELISLLTRRTRSTARISILPPLAWVASVVIEPFRTSNCRPALIEILPALPGPVLLAETEMSPASVRVLEAMCSTNVGLAGVELLVAADVARAAVR